MLRVSRVQWEAHFFVRFVLVRIRCGGGGVRHSTIERMSNLNDLRQDYAHAAEQFGERNPITLGKRSALLGAEFDSDPGSFEDSYDEWEAHLADLDTLLGQEHPDNQAFREKLIDAYVSFDGFAEAARESEVLLDAYISSHGELSPEALRTRTLLVEMSLMSGHPASAYPHFLFIQQIADQAGVEGLVQVVKNLHFHLIGAAQQALSADEVTSLATDYLARYGAKVDGVSSLNEEDFARQERVRGVLLSETSALGVEDTIELAHDGIAVTKAYFGSSDPRVVESMVPFAAALERFERPQEAVTVIDDMIALISAQDSPDPLTVASLHRRSASLRTTAGDLIGARGDYEQALGLAQRAKVPPAVFGTRYDLAVLRTVEGDIDGAIEELSTLLADARGADFVFISAVSNTLASLLADSGQHAKALKIKEDVVALRDNPDQRMELATWCESVGLFDRARKEYAEIFRQLHQAGKEDTPFAKAVAERMQKLS